MKISHKGPNTWLHTNNNNSLDPHSRGVVSGRPSVQKKQSKVVQKRSNGSTRTVNSNITILIQINTIVEVQEPTNSNKTQKTRN